MKYEALIALVLSGCSVSRELADLVVWGSESYTEPKVALFNAPVLSAGELETVVSELLDEES